MLRTPRPCPSSLYTFPLGFPSGLARDRHGASTPQLSPTLSRSAPPFPNEAPNSFVLGILCSIQLSYADHIFATLSKRLRSGQQVLRVFEMKWGSSFWPTASPSVRRLHAESITKATDIASKGINRPLLALTYRFFAAPDKPLLQKRPDWPGFRAAQTAPISFQTPSA